MASTSQKRPGANAGRANAEVQRFLATLASSLYQEEGLRFSAQIRSTYDSSKFITWSFELAEGHGRRTIQKIEGKSGPGHKEFSHMLRAVGSSPSLTSATFKGESFIHGSNMRDEWRQIFIELKASRTLQELEITPHDLGKEGVQAIGDFLCACASVRKFTLDCMDSGVTDMVVEAVLASKHTLEELCLINFRRRSSLLEALTPDSSGLQSNTSLRHLKLVQWQCNDHVTTLANILQQNSSLTKFSMTSTQSLNPAYWIALLDSLKQNVSIRVLDFSHCGGIVGTAVLDAVIELLKANPRLERIELEGTALKDNGSAMKVESHLARKARNMGPTCINLEPEEILLQKAERALESDVKRCISVLTSPPCDPHSLRIAIRFRSSKFLEVELYGMMGSNLLETAVFEDEFGEESCNLALLLLQAVFESPNMKRLYIQFGSFSRTSLNDPRHSSLWREMLAMLGSNQTAEWVGLTPFATQESIGNKAAADMVEAVAHMLGGNSALSELILDKWSHVSIFDCARLAEALTTNITLEILSIKYQSGESLRALLKPLVPDETMHQPNNSIKELHLVFKGDVGKEGVESLAQLLQFNHSLSTMSLRHIRQSCDIIPLLEALKHNNTLKSLDLSGSDGVDGAEVLATILDLLRVNLSLESLCINKTPLKKEGSNSIIQFELGKRRSNDKLALKDMNMVPPTSTRVFICGHPFAGKTTLRRSLMKFAQPRTSIRGWTMSKLKNLTSFFLNSEVSERTIGIEVEMMQYYDVRIYLWDLGGQDEFHAFHDLMVPNLSEHGSACSFIIVCNPMNRDHSDIDEELQYWLKFISSNTRPSIKFKPHVVVVFTHIDDDPNFQYRHDVKDLMSFLCQRFEVSVDLCPNWMSIDARSMKLVEPLATFITNSICKSLHRLPMVSKACMQMEGVIDDWLLQHPCKPVITWSVFKDLCESNPLLSSSHIQNATVVEERQKAVANFLHEAGQIIYLDALDFMVLDPNWFCHNIMGFILSMNRSPLKPGGTKVRIENGVIHKDDLQSILEMSFSGKGTHRKLEDVRSEDLIKIMMRMSLCFEQVGMMSTGREAIPRNFKGIFIPATLRDENKDSDLGKRRLKWRGMESPQCFVGRRLECKDSERTFLTTGFFPRLQVKFHQIFGSDASFTLEKNLISFMFNGLEIFIEYSGQLGCYIDVLVRSLNEKEKTLKIVQDRVVEPIRDLCATATNGCQGVILVEGILRPACVEGLWLCVNRRFQVQQVEKLKRMVLLEGDLEYKHIWDVIGEANYPPGFDKAMELLGEVEWDDVLDRRRFILEECSNELRLPGTSINPMVQEPLQFKRVFSGPSEQTALHDALGDQMDDAVNHISRQLNDMAKKMEDIRLLQTSLLPELSKKLDLVVDFPTNLLQRQVPRLVYFTTEDRGIGDRLMCLVPGTTSIQLHLMCESHEQIHKVEGQEGVFLTLEGDTARKIRPYAVWGLRLLTLLLRIGGSAAAGVGGMVPDLARICTGLSNVPMVPANLGAGSVSLEQMGTNSKAAMADNDKIAAEQWLIDFLRGKDIGTSFGLYRVVYLEHRRRTQHIAWVCERHMKPGLQTGRMQLCPTTY